MSNIISYVRPSDFGADRKDINRILEMIHDVVAQEAENEGLKQRILVKDHVRKRSSTGTSGGANLLNTDVLDRENFIWRRKKPLVVGTYNMVHTQIGGGDLLFPVSDTWFGARCDADGTNYIRIDDDDILDPTTELTIALKLYLPASGGGFVVCEKVNQYRLRVINTNILEFAVYVSGAYKTAVTFIYTPNTKYSVICTYKSTSSGQKLYIDGILEDSDSETGDMVGTSNDFGLFATGAGASIALVNTRIAAFHMGSKEADSGWITKYENGILDTSDGFDEITTIFFTGDDRVTPDAETGLFKSS